MHAKFQHASFKTEAVHSGQSKLLTDSTASVSKLGG